MRKNKKNTWEMFIKTEIKTIKALWFKIYWEKKDELSEYQTKGDNWVASENMK